MLKKILSRILPRKAKDAVKYAARTPKRLRVHSKRLTEKPVTKQGIVSGLKALGIRQGDTLMVHSSLSAFGFVEGGPMAVINALLELVGKEGNVCMPTFAPLPKNVFDVRSTKSALGKISDTFWRLPQAKRSLEPTHNVACIGKDAEYICSGQENDKTAFTKNSPYAKVIELDGWLLVLGSYIGRVTIWHVLEDEVGGKFPLKVYMPKPTKFTVIKEDGSPIQVEQFEHDRRLDPLRLDNNLAVGNRIKKDLIGLGYLKVGKIGNAEILAIKTRSLMKALRLFLNQGKTIYAGKEETRSNIEM